MSVVLKVAATKNHALKVPDGDDQIAMLHSALEDSIYISWEVNNTYQAYFTAWDDESAAYQMLTVQNMVEIDGQWFVIKQCEPDYSGGIGTTAVTLQHISGEISRMHFYGSDPVDWGQYSHTGNSDVSLDVPDNADTVAHSVSPGDILNAFFGGNKGKNWNITYQVIGSFNNTMVESPYAAGSGKDAISRILGAWSSAVFWPDNLNLRIYSHDEFYKDYGHRYDYLRDTPEVQLQYDTTDMTNAARLVGATQEIQTTSDTGLPNGSLTASGGAQSVIADAKKYLGVPYVYGGGRPVGTANPYNGMDCSSFVSRVYYDFGINIPAYTVSMESYGHEISRDQVQTGDMGFYGSKGASHHICMALDNSTMIYEPQPGEVCKTEPISYYPPTWWERNDDMAKIVAGSSSGGDDDGTASTTDSKEQYYFAPFYFVDEASHQRWGLFVGDDITNDTITDKEQMKAYAESQFKANPDFTLQLTVDPSKEIVEGDMVRLEIRPADYVTKVGLVGYQKYPYSHTQSSTVMLNSNAANILDFQRSQQTNLSRLQEQTKSLIISSNNRDDSNNTWSETEVKAFDSSKRS
ncbi:hypothetical protein HC010_07595 [Limosilactobacillus fermentum]